MTFTWKMEDGNQEQSQGSMLPVSTYMPTIRKEMKGGVMATDAISELYDSRIIYMTSEFNDSTCTAVQAQMFYLDANIADPSKSEIKLYINSPGGSVTAGLALYNTMQNIQSDVVTIGMGICASMGAFLLCTGAPGMRFAFPDTTIMIHEPSSGTQGRHRHNKAHMKFGDRLYDLMIGTMAAHCNISFEELEAAMAEDNFLSAEQALKLGLIDGIIPPPKGKTRIVPRQPLVPSSQK